MNNGVQKMNSLMPLPANSVKNIPKVNSIFPSLPKANSILKNMPVLNTIAKANSPVANNTGKGWNTPMLWFSILLFVILMLLGIYYREIIEAMNKITDKLRLWLTGYGSPPEEKQENIPVAPPTPPQDEATANRHDLKSRIVERIIPPAKEVFTVSKNNFSYYDAAPLCKALGAELATYEQVKDAWQKGADWCNYGWVKGQMAVFPTQNSTYEELQEGPADQKGACGKPGLNGGYFDNPELKFGVTCAGKRPSQSQHDATAIMAGSTKPLTVSGLEFDKKVQHFKQDAEVMGILPFNKERWGS